jgi:DNA polymerase IV (DinB-like DNA polymerase)
LRRVIGHIDIDYFYAQVEEVENPSIKGRPVVVCVFSGRTEDSGVVSTANYKARESGVKSGIPIVTAKRLLMEKDPIFVRLNLAKYESVSASVMDVVRPQVDMLEESGIDEAFFDITQKSVGDFGRAVEVAKKIKQSVFDEVHLTCSIGIGRSKAVAKLGSDVAKPGGLLVIPPERAESFLRGLQVTKLYGVGPKTAEKLRSLGIRTISQLASADISDLTDSFGKKLAVYLSSAANGMDDDPVEPNRAPTQLSRLVTLRSNTTDPEEALAELGDALRDLNSKLASQNASYRTLTAIAILTDLNIKTRSHTFETPMIDLSSSGDVLLGLFSELSESTDKEFRRVGVRVSDLSPNQDQESLAGYLPWP